MSESPSNHYQRPADAPVLLGQDAAPKAPRRGGGKRTPLSCLACRQHKLRCDRRVPCSTCIRYRREAQCQRNPAPTRRHRVHISGELSQEPSTELQGRVLHHVHRQSSQAEIEDGRLLQNEPLISHRAISNTGSPSVSQGFMALAKLLGLSAHMDGGTSPSLPQLLAEANRVEPLSSWWSFLDPQHRQKLWRQQLSAILPSRSQCDLLTNYYLEHINWIFQVIHVPSFRREYSRFWEVGVGQVDLIWLSLLLTIISVSALYVPFETVEVVGCPRDSIRHLARVWHLASQHASRAGECDAKPCLTQLQTFSVTQLYWYATNNIETMNSYVHSIFLP